VYTSAGFSRSPPREMHTLIQPSSVRNQADSSIVLEIHRQEDMERRHAIRRATQSLNPPQHENESNPSTQVTKENPVGKIAPEKVRIYPSHATSVPSSTCPATLFSASSSACSVMAFTTLSVEIVSSPNLPAIDSSVN
jgi:hypothetical protein